MNRATHFVLFQIQRQEMQLASGNLVSEVELFSSSGETAGVPLSKALLFLLLILSTLRLQMMSRSLSFERARLTYFSCTKFVFS